MDIARRIPQDALIAGLSLPGRTTGGYIGGALFELWLYGLFTILHLVSVYLLWVHRRAALWPFLVVSVLTFLIATTDVVLTILMLYRDVLQGREISAPLVYPKFIFYVTNSVLADVILIYRCYVVWGRNLRPILLPGILLVGSTVCGYLFTVPTSAKLRGLLPIYMWMTFSLNVLVTMLTAGRIIWMAKKTNEALGPHATREYYSIGAVIIESGLIYSVYILLDLLLATIILDMALVQVVGIVPALIIVQVALGRSSHDPNITINPQRTARDSSTPVLDSIFSTADSHLTDIQPHNPSLSMRSLSTRTPSFLRPPSRTLSRAPSITVSPPPVNGSFVQLPPLQPLPPLTFNLLPPTPPNAPLTMPQNTSANLAPNPPPPPNLPPEPIIASHTNIELSRIDRTDMDNGHHGTIIDV